ncbi:saccharopine dehydrogenase NADP-binding domain-containing protein [Lentzea sp. HUAS12]|uniref:saccharopine dehydrogenase NADP-binding domain-containing protein n=1 Tax=Lentzea sp. HUAS12 TaxID=2951806 RepID=UPI00209ECAB0|nr:saccharopine dehydrogenase NADP-binding domain-containing protein [Lentzea sp. HUAS12]USX53516.1 saccharopine dehydrogenase NADP-binding domain-containing protein [Lentzea sp. HUAS12]
MASSTSPSPEPTGTVLVIGMGNMGERLAYRLAEGGRVARLVLAGRSAEATGAIAGTAASISGHVVEPVVLDATRQDDIADLLARTRPDLVVQCAAVRGPWTLAGREDAVASAVVRAGLALRLPYQLPVPLAVMRAARDADYAGPVANLSFPDVTGPVLARLGLAPTLGLGNAAMIQLRVRAALRATRPDAGQERIRVVAHHSQLVGAMASREPDDPADRCRVFLGEDGRREDGLAYQAPPIAPSQRYNEVTAAATIPVLHALLPGAAPLRWSTAAPGGLPGGYPVLIDNGAVTLDLPPGADRDESIAFNEEQARGDGVERVDSDGTVHFTAEVRDAVADFDPGIADPLPVADLEQRVKRLDDLLM